MQIILQSMPHPWIVIEDAHINLINVLEYFHKYMIPGDYFIIDDTAPTCPVHSGNWMESSRPQFEFSRNTQSLRITYRFVKLRPQATLEDINVPT